MKICFIVPYYYKWNNFSNVRSTYETLQSLGHEVDLFRRMERYKIKYNTYDQIWLMGSGAWMTKNRFAKMKVPVISFGWSDPNLYLEDHMKNCNLYCTNDLRTYRKIARQKLAYYHQTACDKRYHKNLNLERTTEILVYGVGRHPFVPNRNEVVNKLRKVGFKIKVFGRKWDRHPDTYKFIEGQKFLEEINKAKILLDLTNRKTALGHRIFEGCGCGTPVMTMYREDTSLLFTDKSEIIMYNNFNELLSLLKYYLNRPNLLTIIGKNAQNRCYNDHDIINRIVTLLKYLKKLS